MLLRNPWTVFLILSQTKIPLIDWKYKLSINQIIKQVIFLPEKTGEKFPHSYQNVVWE